MPVYAWGGFVNGKIPDYAMKTVRGIRLFAQAADAFEAMCVAFEKRFGHRLEATEGYRPQGNPGDWLNKPRVPNTQWYYWERWNSNKAKYPNGAYPGGSIHGWGKAVDIDLSPDWMTAEMIEWLHTEGRRYGFNWDTTGRLIGEPWHLDFNLLVTAYLDIEPEEPPTPKEQAEDMARFINAHGANGTPDAARAAVFFQAKEGEYFIPLSPAETGEFAKNYGVDMSKLPDNEFAQVDLLNNAIERSRGAKPSPAGS